MVEIVLSIVIALVCGYLIGFTVKERLDCNAYWRDRGSDDWS